MARVVGGIGTSHLPTIRLGYGKGQQDEPAAPQVLKNDLRGSIGNRDSMDCNKRLPRPDGSV